MHTLTGSGAMRGKSNLSTLFVGTLFDHRGGLAGILHRQDRAQSASAQFPGRGSGGRVQSMD
eukprot:11193578-Lingulodinium_polyedra.AAC.1